MTEQKRPVLTLKRKTEGETPTRSRKTIINVTTPPKWKVKKQKLAEKAAREAELAAKKAQARQALSIYLTLPSLDEAVNTLKPWWPGLFDGNTRFNFNLIKVSIVINYQDGFSLQIRGSSRLATTKKS